MFDQVIFVCPNQDLHLTLEEQKTHIAQLTQTLEHERKASSQLSQQAEQEHLSLHRRLQELQVQLETERAKAQEMSAALVRERELRTGGSSESGPSNEEQVQRGHKEEGSLLERLQRELDDKHAQVGSLSCLSIATQKKKNAFSFMVI